MDEASVEEELVKVRSLLVEHPGNAAYVELEKSLLEALDVLRSVDDEDEDEDEDVEHEEEVRKEESGREEEERRGTDARESAKASESEKELGKVYGNSDTAESPREEPPRKRRNVDEAATDGAGSTTEREKLERIPLGQHCEVFDDGLALWQSATLETYADDRGEAKVRTLHNGKQKSVAIKLIRPIRSKVTYDRTKLLIGLECSAMYSGDGRWYKAVVLKLTRDGCVVRFDKYRNEEEVAFEHLDPDFSSSESSGQLKSQVVAQVPKHLVVSEADSESSKKRKERAMHKLRQESNRAHKEVVLDQKRQGWQSFQSKKLKR